MVVEKKISINNLNYYIGVELKYVNGDLKKLDGSYFDSGDLSYLIKNVEENYDKTQIYYEPISYLNDIFYIYDHFPFLTYIKDVFYNKENQISSLGIIYKEEILKNIAELNVKVGRFNGEKSVCPLLFKSVDDLKDYY